MTDTGFPLPTDDELTPEAREVIAALPPLNVFRAVAALPASLRPFLELGASLLAGQNLTPAERELAILRVAHLTEAGYERQQHEQLAAAVGLDAGQIAATASDDPATGPRRRRRAHLRRDRRDHPSTSASPTPPSPGSASAGATTAPAS